jgi:hypothetical protein
MRSDEPTITSRIRHLNRCLRNLVEAGAGLEVPFNLDVADQDRGRA